MNTKSQIRSLLNAQFRVLVLLVVLFFSGVGGVIVQTIGWATMLPKQFSQTGSIVQAVENTFDGDHQCELCRVAAKLHQASEGSSDHSTPAEGKNSGAFKPLISQLHTGISLARPQGLFIGVWQVEHEVYDSVDGEPTSPPPQG